MSWDDTDDAELQECLDRLIDKQNELQSQLTPIQTIINNSRVIQTRTQKQVVEKTVDNVTIKEDEIIKILPKDQWGVDMTDDARLIIKDECVTKTNELLGEPDGDDNGIENGDDDDDD